MTLVLIAPIGLDAHAWDGVELPDGPIVRHELPGFGARRNVAARAPFIGELADEVAAAYRGPLDVAGVSMGAMVAQHLAVRHPDRVRSALVACTGPSADPATMGERAAAARAHGMAGVLGTTLERWFTPAALAADPPHPGVAYGRRTLLALDPEAFAQGWETIATHDATPRLGEVRATVTCVAGAQDVSAPPSRVRAVADAVPGARFVVVDGPHVLPLEEPATFASVLREHLRAAAVG